MFKAVEQIRNFGDNCLSRKVFAALSTNEFDGFLVMGVSAIE
jgi:hypothetical protein